MRQWTWGEIKGKIQRKHGIEGSSDYTEQELMDMANEGVNMVEAEVISLNQDYFLTSSNIDIVAGQTEYDLPADIFASKIRRAFYKKPNSKSQKIYSVRNLDDLIESREQKYLILNHTSGRKLVLSQPPETDASLTLYHTRNSKEFILSGGDSQPCDIPEFVDAVLAWMSYLIEFEDKSPTVQVAKDDYDRITNNLRRTLAQAVNDEDYTIHPDMSFDNDHI